MAANRSLLVRSFTPLSLRMVLLGGLMRSIILVLLVLASQGSRPSKDLSRLIWTVTLRCARLILVLSRGIALLRVLRIRGPFDPAFFIPVSVMIVSDLGRNNCSVTHTVQLVRG